MLYGILRLLFRITFKVFFRNAYKHRPELVPADGPLIICANHPGAFLDPVVIATIVKRKVYFLAKGSVFKGAFAKWFLPRLNIVPVYRAQDDATQMHKNEETFIRCYEHLAKGGVLLIFPEGISITERKLRPVKTGAARIALGAEAKYGNKLGVKISCIGLNYEDPHTFRRDVYISYSEPINVLDYAPACRSNGTSGASGEKYKTEEFAAAEELTEDIRKRLEEQMIHTADEETDRLVGDIERLYKNDLLKEQGIKDGDKEGAFALSKRIVLTVNFFREREPHRVEKIAQDIRAYFQKIDELGLSDKLIKGGAKGSRWLKNLKELLFIVIGFPVFIYGLLHNYLCFFLANLLSTKLVKAREYKGAIGAAAGMFLYLIWYIALGIVSWKFMHHHSYFDRPGWEWLLYFVSWPATGLFAWYYYCNLRYINKRWVMMSLFYREANLVAELILVRNKLIKELEQAIVDRDKHGIEPWMYRGKGINN